MTVQRTLIGCFLNLARRQNGLNFRGPPLPQKALLSLERVAETTKHPHDPVDNNSYLTMKLSTALIIASAASLASAQSIRSHAAKASLLNKSRRLEQDQEEDIYGFLSNYAIKLIGCAAGEQYTNPETAEVEYSSVIYRLCPVDSCDDASATGCKKGYGDFAVGLQTFVQEWLEDKRDNMQQDDMFKVEQLGECREYMVDNDAQEDGEEAVVYYVGPACGSEKAEIVVGLFSEATCVTPAAKTFEEISNGWSLPYSTSGAGLVTNACEMCAGYDDQGAYGVSDMCTTLFDGAASKCMTGMESLNSYGADETGCSYIQNLVPKTSSSKAGAAVGWTIFALVIVGAAAYGYTKWWLKKKQTSSLASDGM